MVTAADTLGLQKNVENKNEAVKSDLLPELKFQVLRSKSENLEAHSPRGLASHSGSLSRPPLRREAPEMLTCVVLAVAGYSSTTSFIGQTRASAASRISYAAINAPDNLGAANKLTETLLGDVETLVRELEQAQKKAEARKQAQAQMPNVALPAQAFLGTVALLTAGRSLAMSQKLAREREQLEKVVDNMVVGEATPGVLEGLFDAEEALEKAIVRRRNIAIVLGTAAAGILAVNVMGNDVTNRLAFLPDPIKLTQTIAETAAESVPVLAADTAPALVIPVQAQAQAAASSAQVEMEARAAVDAQRLAAAKAEAQRITAQRAEAERVAALRAEAERVAAESERAAAEAERVARAEVERVTAMEKAEAERVAAEQAELERAAAMEKAEAERMAAKQLAAQAAEVEALAQDAHAKAEAEAVAAEQARAAAAAELVKAEAEAVAAEKAFAQAEAEAKATATAESQREVEARAEEARVAAAAEETAWAKAAQAAANEREARALAQEAAKAESAAERVLAKAQAAAMAVTEKIAAPGLGAAMGVGASSAVGILAGAPSWPSFDLNDPKIAIAVVAAAFVGTLVSTGLPLDSTPFRSKDDEEEESGAAATPSKGEQSSAQRDMKKLDEAEKRDLTTIVMENLGNLAKGLGLTSVVGEEVRPPNLGLRRKDEVPSPSRLSLAAKRDAPTIFFEGLRNLAEAPLGWLEYRKPSPLTSTMSLVEPSTMPKPKTEAEAKAEAKAKELAERAAEAEARAQWLARRAAEEQAALELAQAKAGLKDIAKEAALKTLDKLNTGRVVKTNSVFPDGDVQFPSPSPPRPVAAPFPLPAPMPPSVSVAVSPNMPAAIPPPIPAPLASQMPTMAATPAQQQAPAAMVDEAAAKAAWLAKLEEGWGTAKQAITTWGPKASDLSAEPEIYSPRYIARDLSAEPESNGNQDSALLPPMPPPLPSPEIEFAALPQEEWLEPPMNLVAPPLRAQSSGWGARREELLRKKDERRAARASLTPPAAGAGAGRPLVTPPAAPPAVPAYRVVPRVAATEPPRPTLRPLVTSSPAPPAVPAYRVVPRADASVEVMKARAEAAARRLQAEGGAKTRATRGVVAPTGPSVAQTTTTPPGTMPKSTSAFERAQMRREMMQRPPPDVGVAARAALLAQQQPLPGTQPLFPQPTTSNSAAERRALRTRQVWEREAEGVEMRVGAPGAEAFRTRQEAKRAWLTKKMGL